MAVDRGVAISLAASLRIAAIGRTLAPAVDATATHLGPDRM
jgi:hypothetical protein